MAKLLDGRRGVIIGQAFETLKLGSDENFTKMMKIMKQVHGVDITQDVTSILTSILNEKIDLLDSIDLADRIIRIHFTHDYGKIVCKCELELFKTKCAQSRNYAIGEIE